MQPWQEKTRDSGLALHGALDVTLDTRRLQAEFAVLDRDLAPEARNDVGSTNGWILVPLLERRPEGPPHAAPPLAMMPSVAALLAHSGWHVLGAHLMRQAPRGILPWHCDDQGLHLDETRIVIPIAAPPAAVTWIGHEAAAYPAGCGWTADFSLPHQVENPSAEQRVVLVVDVTVTASLQRLFPSSLAAAKARRRQLARDCSDLLQASWQRRFSADFKRETVAALLGGSESVYGLAIRHAITPGLIRSWVQRHAPARTDGAGLPGLA